MVSFPHHNLVVRGFILNTLYLVSPPTLYEMSPLPSKAVLNQYRETLDLMYKRPLSPYIGIDGIKTALIRTSKICWFSSDSDSLESNLERCALFFWGGMVIPKSTSSPATVVTALRCLDAHIADIKAYGAAYARDAEISQDES